MLTRSKERLVTLRVDVLAQHRSGALCDRQRLDRQANEMLTDEAPCRGWIQFGHNFNLLFR
jgi:hypothetical protein